VPRSVPCLLPVLRPEDRRALPAALGARCQGRLRKTWRGERL